MRRKFIKRKGRVRVGQVYHVDCEVSRERLCDDVRVHMVYKDVALVYSKVLMGTVLLSNGKLIWRVEGA